MTSNRASMVSIAGSSFEIAVRRCRAAAFPRGAIQRRMSRSYGWLRPIGEGGIRAAPADVARGIESMRGIPMPKVRVDNFSVSIDGYGAGPDQDLDNPLGVGGARLHER